MKTLPILRRPKPPPPAAGLYFKGKLFMFEDHPERYIMIGRVARCHIQLRGRHMSKVHAILELRDGTRYIENASPLGGSYLNGEPIVAPTPLRVGDELLLGQYTLSVVGPDRRPLMLVQGFTQLCQAAIRIAGGQRAAGRLLDRDHTVVARHAIPHEERRQTAAERKQAKKKRRRAS